MTFCELKSPALRAVLILTLIVSAMPAFGQKGEAVFGAQAGFTSTNESGTAGLFFQYNFADYLRIAPEVGCVFRHRQEDAFTMDVNFHFPITIESRNAIQVYPLAGVDFSSWTRHDRLYNETDDVSTRTSKFGLNLGGGFQIKTSPTLKLKIEAKYVLMEVYGTFAISAGIGYVF